MSVYLDHAATTRVRPEAAAAFAEVMAGDLGNPSGSHRSAQAARRLLDDARDTMAELLGARPGEVVFTSGGTEADNLALVGVPAARPGRIVCASTEHHAVLEPAVAAGATVVGVLPDGSLDLDALAAALDDTVTLVSVMLVNNETGVVHDLDRVAEVVARRAPHASLHTDAVQAFAWLDVAALAAPAQLVSVSGHKFGAPAGVGVLVVREGTPLRAQLLGGGQERERRSGTPNVAGAVALATAARSAADERKALVDRVGPWRDRLVAGIAAAVPGTHESAVPGTPGPTSDRSHKVAGVAHLCFDGVESEALLFLLDDAGIEASAASSCASGALDPSHVLAAMGVDRRLARGSLRLSLGWSTVEADIEAALAAVPAAVARLRSFA
jgi:cysteine desulfurase